MAARNSSYKLQSLVTLLYRYSDISGAGGSWRSHQIHHRYWPPYKLGYGGSIDQGLRSISVTSRACCSQPKLGMEKEQSEEIKVQEALPARPKFGVSSWVKWLLGSVLSFLLPFWTNKWDNFRMLEGKAEKVVEEVEAVAEVVEKVASTADVVLAQVAIQLPDNSKLKEAAQVMEHVSCVAAHDAQIVDNIIHKVGDVKQDLEDLETMVEPIVDKIMQGKHPKN